MFAQVGREWVVLPGAPSYPQICLDPEEETRFLEQHAPVVSIKKSAASRTGNETQAQKTSLASFQHVRIPGPKTSHTCIQQVKKRWYKSIAYMCSTVVVLSGPP